MGILNGMKEQLAWGNLKYLGGYPGKVLPFVCALHKEGNNIVLYGGGTWKPIFSIPKDDILNLELVKGINKREDRIIVKIKYENMELDLQFSSGNIQLSYNKMVSEIHKETIDSVQAVETKGNEETAIIEKKTSTDGSEEEYFEINFYNKEWFMWVTLILFAPIGIYLLWKHRRYSKNARVVLSIFFGIIFLIALRNNVFNNKQDTKANSTVAEQKQDVKKEEVKEEPKQEDVKTKEVEKPTYKILNSTDEVKENFNNAAEKLNVNFRINNLSVESGDKQNVFKYMINDHIGLVGSVNKKDNTLRSLIMTAQGDGTSESGANMLIATGILVSTIEPSITNDARKQLLKDLGIPSELKNGFSRTIEHNGLKYFVSLDNNIGLSFAIDNAEDK